MTSLLTSPMFPTYRTALTKSTHLRPSSNTGDWRDRITLRSLYDLSPQDGPHDGLEIRTLRRLKTGLVSRVELLHYVAAPAASSDRRSDGVSFADVDDLPKARRVEIPGNRAQSRSVYQIPWLLYVWLARALKMCSMTF